MVLFKSVVKSRKRVTSTYGTSGRRFRASRVSCRPLKFQKNARSFLELDSDGQLMGALLATEVVSEFSLIQRKHAAKFTFKNFHNKIKILPEHFLSSAASEEED